MVNQEREKQTTEVLSNKLATLTTLGKRKTNALFANQKNKKTKGVFRDPRQLEGKRTKQETDCKTRV